MHNNGKKALQKEDISVGTYIDIISTKHCTYIHEQTLNNDHPKHK